MKPTRSISRIVLLAFIILGTLVVSGRADKPEGPSKSLLVSVTGGIAGQGDAAQMQVTFCDDSFGDLARTYVANPDGVLKVARIAGPEKRGYVLEYFYCDHPDHNVAECVCRVPSHNPSNYRCLYIYDGTLEGSKGTEHIRFPAGSEWQIRSKEPYGVVVASGQLASPVTYKELK